MSLLSDQLSRLREIGWTLWDPIGLASVRSDCEDEYDHYLLEAFEKTKRGSTLQEVVDYLAKIEASRMGLGLRPTALPRAIATAKAIRSYIQALSA